MRFLKTALLTLVLLGFQYLQAQEAQEETYNFDLDDCIKYALENNQEVKNADLDTYAAKAFIGETMSIGLPQVNAGVDLTNNYKVPTSFIPGDFIPGGADSDSILAVAFQPQYGGNASITATQLIFDGSYFVGLKASKVYQELSIKDLRSTKIDIMEAVSKAYYNVLVSHEGYDLVQNNYNRLDTLLNDTEALYEAGFSEKIDVNRVKVQFNNIKVQLKNSYQDLALSYLILKFYMGMPVKTPLVLKEKIRDLKFEELDLEVQDFDYSRRVEYSRLETQRTLAATDLKYTNSQYLPKLEFFAGYGTNTGANNASDLFSFTADDQWFGYGNFGLALSVPIFDGLQKHYKAQQNKVKISQVENSFELLQNNIDLEINTSRVSYVNAVNNLRAQQENMVLAEEVFNVAKIKYEQGVGSNIEVIDADSSYKEAQTNYYNALFDALIARVDFLKATGALQFEQYETSDQ